MKISKICLIAFLVCYSLKLSAQTSKPWKLVWADEFNYVGPPNPDKWVCEGNTRRNHEAQVYTDRKENVYVKGGYLTITGLKEEYKNIRYQRGSLDWEKVDRFRHYTSASITTQNKASWKYGKIEVRAKVPAGLGTWPAIWMLGVDNENLQWPRYGEIDIMEAQGFRPNITTGTLHYEDPSTHRPIQTGDNITPLNTALSNDFHIFTAIWDSVGITLLCDNKTVLAYKFPDKRIVYNERPFYLLINLGLGGIGGRTIDDRIFPAKFLIDYVRVYQTQ